MTDPSDASPAWLEDATGHQVPIQGSCALGRSVSNQVTLPDERISRRHAIIQAQGEDEFWVVDFGSRNGTYLNGRRIMNPTHLHHGDRLRIGSFEFVFHQPHSKDLAHLKTLGSNATVADIRLVRCWLLVADIVNSSQLVQELPPDEVPLVTGQWVAECKQTLEAAGGRINQFMGDGFFGYWRDHTGIEIAVDKALRALQRLQEQSRPNFRWVLHLGQVAFGGFSVGEEERLSGSEMHFVFRMEKLAGSLNELRLLSEPAWNRLAALVGTREVGCHTLTGFADPYRFYAC